MKYPPVAKSAEALILRRMNDPTKAYAFTQGQSPCLRAEVQFLAFFLYRSSGTQVWSSAKADRPKFKCSEKKGFRLKGYSRGSTEIKNN